MAKCTWKLSDIEREVLMSTREMLRTDDSSGFVCLDMDEVVRLYGKAHDLKNNPDLAIRHNMMFASALRLKSDILSLTYPFSNLDSWVANNCGITLGKDTKMELRVAWVTWMLGERDDDGEHEFGLLRYPTKRT